MSTIFDQKTPELDQWISQAEAARIRGISRQAIGRLVKKGRFELLKIGGRSLLRRADVEDYRAETPGRPRNENKTRRN